MRHKIISVSRAKAKFLEIIRNVNNEGQAFLLTKDGEPIGALVPMEDYEALLETSDILSDRNTLDDLEEALKEEKKGNIWKRSKSGKWIKKTKSKKNAA